MALRGFLLRRPAGAGWAGADLSAPLTANMTSNDRAELEALVAHVEQAIRELEKEMGELPTLGAAGTG